MQFKEYLLNPDNNEFNTDRYKICTYLHQGTMDRVCPMCVLWNPLNGTSKEVSEISFFLLALSYMIQSMSQIIQ